MANYLQKGYNLLKSVLRKKDEGIEKIIPKPKISLQQERSVQTQSIPRPKTTLPKKRITMEDLKKTKPLFEKGTVVVITYDGKKDIGIIDRIDTMVDWRNSEATWGYVIDFIGKGDKTFPFLRIPERYVENFFKQFTDIKRS